MLANAPRTMVKHPKQISFYEKNYVIVTLSKITSYISKTKFLYVDFLTNAKITTLNFLIYINLRMLKKTN